MFWNKVFILMLKTYNRAFMLLYLVIKWIKRPMGKHLKKNKTTSPGILRDILLSLCCDQHFIQLSVSVFDLFYNLLRAFCALWHYTEPHTDESL